MSSLRLGNSAAGQEAGWAAVLENDAVRQGIDKEVELGTDADEQETERVGPETVFVGLEIGTEGLWISLDELGKNIEDLETVVAVQENGAVHGESAADLKVSRRQESHCCFEKQMLPDCKRALPYPGKKIGVGFKCLTGAPF